MPMSIAKARVEAVEAHARPVRRAVKTSAPPPPLTSVVSVAPSALVQVGVVARVPDHAVVAAFAEHLVVGVAAGQRVVLRAAEELVEAALAENGVVARLAEQEVVAGAADDRVVAGASEDVGARQGAVRLVERQDIVAALAEHLDQRGVGDRRRAAEDGDRAAVDQELAGRVAADHDVVSEVVAEHGQDTGRGRE